MHLAHLGYGAHVIHLVPNKVPLQKATADKKTPKETKSQQENAKANQAPTNIFFKPPF